MCAVRSHRVRTGSLVRRTPCARCAHAVRTMCARCGAEHLPRERVGAGVRMRCSSVSTQPCTLFANLPGLARALAIATAEVRMVWVPGTDYPPAQQHVGYPVSVQGVTATCGEWARHVQQAVPELSIYELARHLAETNAQLRDAVRSGRRAGLSWPQIARAAGIDTDHAAQRWGPSATGSFRSPAHRPGSAAGRLPVRWPSRTAGCGPSPGPSSRSSRARHASTR